MEWLTDPTVWVGLLTLVVLEIVLGIDNLIFIAILADKLPPGSATARASSGFPSPWSCASACWRASAG